MKKVFIISDPSEPGYVDNVQAAANQLEEWGYNVSIPAEMNEDSATHGLNEFELLKLNTLNYLQCDALVTIRDVRWSKMGRMFIELAANLKMPIIEIRTLHQQPYELDELKKRIYDRLGRITNTA